LNNYDSQDDKTSINQLNKLREEVFGIINKIDKTIIDSQNIRIANAFVVKDVVHECGNNHAGKKDAPLIVQFDEQKKNIYRLTGKIDNYLKYSINNKCGARDLNLNKKSDEAISSQNGNNFLTKIVNKGESKGIPVIGVSFVEYKPKNQCYQPRIQKLLNNDLGKFKS